MAVVRWPCVAVGVTCVVGAGASPAARPARGSAVLSLRPWLRGDALAALGSAAGAVWSQAAESGAGGARAGRGVAGTVGLIWISDRISGMSGSLVLDVGPS